MSSQRFRFFCWLTLSITVLVILWGALVRATGSGAGCGSHWPTCNGQVLPQIKVNKTWIEFTHRVTSGLAFLFVFIQGFWAFRRFPKSHLVRQASVASMSFMLLEILIGAIIVRLNLVAQNASVTRAIVVPLHLCNTFLLLGSLTILVWAMYADSILKSIASTFEKSLSTKWIFFGILMTLLIAMSGSIVALGDTIFPVKTLQEGIAQDFSNTAHFLIRLRIGHPIAAIIIGLFVVYTSQAIARRAGGFAKSMSALITIFFILQFAVGFLNFAMLAPLYLQMIHLLLAQLSWIALILFYTTIHQTLKTHRISCV